MGEINYMMNNLLGITDKFKLQEIECELVEARIRQLYNQDISGDFSVKHLKSIHKHLFQDLYPWAGEYREGGFASKNRVLDDGTSHIVEYSYSDYLEHNLKAELDKLKVDKFYTKIANKEDFCNNLAKLYNNLDFLHPFPEGNSRTLREFTRQLALNAGYDIKWEKTLAIKDKLYTARDIAVNNNDSSKLKEIFLDIVEITNIKVKKVQKSKPNKHVGR